eukprot:CAMPEP_0194035034 /NCGR_PEP_ID=MMETSP0009_2-20130614/7498_1 /TAXON_ID=210454 /ORGANISM="Grammatophora oceanica, Strain CCMP 410" /LENGTH=54 /DNA_ID=CAMNT_0038676235 /DNA_START=236 /DNA_END=400 /DNA_ORIENTATION=-
MKNIAKISNNRQRQQPTNDRASAPQINPSSSRESISAHDASVEMNDCKKGFFVV